ncbi:MAG: hypothetical protein JNL74_13255, partial [Fibrobacteres bacterium]|nr:hypothetical protein [Fibrobacterota bacterium]
MVKLITSLSVLFLLPYLSYSAALQFVSPPAMSKDGSAWKVTFELNRTSDVEVSIVNPVDSTVVRHLAAGMLGTNPPPPLTAGSAAQTIFWDGKDDFGKTVSQPEALTVRVRSGLGVKLTGIAGEDMYSIDGGTGGLVLGDNGSVIVLGTRLFGHGPRSFIREYSASGIYVRTLYPPPASLPADSVSAYSINLCNSAWSPRTGNIESAPQITNTLASNGGVLSPIGLPGQMVLTMGNDMQIMSTNGAVYPTRKIINSPAAPTGYSMMGPSYMIASEDSSYFYLSGRYFGQVNMGSWLTNALTTGFWADGQVFRVNRKTGVVSQWLLIDSVPVTSAER